MKKLLMASVLFLGAVSAHAGSTRYECSPESGNATDQTLVISGDNLTVTSTDALNGMKFKAKLDESYKPRNGSKKVRFVGSEKGNDRKVLVYDQMLEGARTGYVQIQGNEDGYWSSEYKCYLK